MYFENRFDAAQQLAPLLDKYKLQDPVVLAIPRGGVPIGCFLSKQLEAPLDLLMVKKIGHPKNSEYAIGAVFLEGEQIDEREDIPNSYFTEQINTIRNQLKKRYASFKPGQTPIDLTNKSVIIVDDGIATGRTIQACINCIRAKHPRQIIIAVPVSSQEAKEKIVPFVDDFISLYIPYPFIGVGRFYSDFSQVEDTEVKSMLCS
jgi:predicted phosphoribosyltransferase